MTLEKINTFGLFKIRLLRLFSTQDWIRFSIRYRAVRFFASAYSYEFETNFFGLKYKGNLQNHIDSQVYFYGAYEKPNLLLMRKLLSRTDNPVCLDIGANTGHHSLFLPKYSSQVHSFEPYAGVRDICERRIRDNALTNITVHGVALGDADGELDYYAPISNNTGTGSFVSQREGNQSAGKHQVFRGDTYIKTLSLAKIDLIKIDVEGFEKEVLDGMKEVLVRYRPTVIIEFSKDTKVKFGSSENMMKVLPENYQIFNIRSNRPAFLFFNRMEGVLEDFDWSRPSENILIMPK